MKRKLMIGTIVGLLLGGGIGAVALADEFENKQMKTIQSEITSTGTKVDQYLNDVSFINNQKQTVKISREEAISIATKDTPGEVWEVEFDDDGYYEIDIFTGQSKVEYKIDANTGEIFAKELDDDRYDDDRYDDDWYDDDRYDDRYDNIY